jgi:hypothetical protein
MPGYSNTPLPKKLSIQPGFRIWVVNCPTEVTRLLKSEFAECTMATNLKSPVDFAMLFSKSTKELTLEFLQVSPCLALAGMLWVSWPKKTSGVLTDLDEDVVREIGLKAGLVDVKVCAVTEIWSGLKFVRRVKDRMKPTKMAATKK